MITPRVLCVVALLLALATTGQAQRQPKGGNEAFSEFEKQKPLAGDVPARLHLRDTSGAEVDLRDFQGAWVVIEFGSYT